MFINAPFGHHREFVVVRGIPTFKAKPLSLAQTTFPELGWRHLDVFLENFVEGRLGVETDFFGDGEHGVVFVSRIEQFLLGLFDAIGVDEVRKAFAQTFVDSLREMGRWDS